MNKYLFVVMALVLGACNNTPNQSTGKESKSDRISRNTSINRNNAYNDLFLDSNQVEQFITQQHLNDTITGHLRDFYNARNFQFAWFSSDGLNDQALAFRTLYDYNDTSNGRKKLDRTLDSLMSGDSLQAITSNPYFARTELMLTWRFINYVAGRYDDKRAQQIALTQLVPSKKQPALTMADKVLAGKDDEKIVNNEWHKALKKQVKQYVEWTAKNGWSALPVPPKKIKRGSSNKFLVEVKKRLIQTGDLTAGDTSAAFTPELEASVKKLQQQYGQAADGVIGASFIKALNIPAEVRLQQLLVNLERMRWMPASAKGPSILVNIPEFRMHVRDGSDSVFNMDIVVGKEGHSTVMFSGELNQVVFSPYWNLPAGIVEKEVLSEIQKNSNYLQENNMEITGEEDGLPVIRQLPGDKNELGKVKFLFPNSFNIYFHDTPHKELFKRSDRAFSHGCIRLSEPVKLAKWLLRDQPTWTPEKIDSAMNSDKEKYVKVKEPVPVLIYYYTAWADANGNMQWREDIYGHDKKMAERLFSPTTTPLASAKK
jgi:L,D-transpeptidase YcbB